MLFLLLKINKNSYTSGFFNSKRGFLKGFIFHKAASISKTKRLNTHPGIILLTSLNSVRVLSFPSPDHHLLGPVLIPGGSHSWQQLFIHHQADSSTPTAQIPCPDPNKSISVPGECGNPYPKPWRNSCGQCLIPHQQADYFVIESNQMCQAHSDLGESLLAFPTHVLHLTCDSPRRIHSITFPETKVRLMHLKFPRPSFQPSL